jgi:hypothetical protein
MLPKNEEKLRDLCKQAMNEDDVNKLLIIFLALDRAARAATAEGNTFTEDPSAQGHQSRKYKEEQNAVFRA